MPNDIQVARPVNLVPDFGPGMANLREENPQYSAFIKGYERAIGNLSPEHKREHEYSILEMAYGFIKEHVDIQTRSRLSSWRTLSMLTSSSTSVRSSATSSSIQDSSKQMAHPSTSRGSPREPAVSTRPSTSMATRTRSGSTSRTPWRLAGQLSFPMSPSMSSTHAGDRGDRNWLGGTT